MGINSFAAVVGDNDGAAFITKITRGNVTIQQFDEFTNIYDIKEGDRMYIVPKDRIAVW